MKPSPGTSAPLFGTVAVLGAGIAGLLSARVLTEHAREVVLIERDAVRGLGVAHRPGIPQGQHPHNLLASGRQVLEALFPGLGDELHAAGAPQGGGAFFAAGGYLEAPADGGSLYASRALLEEAIRRRVLAIPTLRLLEGMRAELPAPEGGRITQVEVHPADGGPTERLAVDLVVDARGRGSRTPAWLAASGYPMPEVERVDVGMRYATRELRRTPEGEALMGGRRFFVVSPVPGRPRAGGVLAKEGGRWIVTLIGYFGDQPPLDEQGFAAYARQLPTPEIAALIESAEPASEIRGFAFPANTRARYDLTPRRPAGLLVVGDALASFSPSYGQGMSVAALQASAMQRLLQTHARSAKRGRDLETDWYRAALAVTDLPWSLAAGGDRQLAPGGPHGSWPQRLRSRWVCRVIRAGHRDAEVAAAFVRVTRLLASPMSLLRPSIVLRVLRA